MKEFYLDLGTKMDKLIALYTVGHVDGIPEWTRDMFGGWQPSVSKVIYTLFRAADARAMDP